MKAHITLTPETEARAKAEIDRFVAQIQNGVTTYSANGFLANILLDLDLEFDF